MVQSVHWRRIHGTDHLQNAVEVVKFLENLQDLNDPWHNSYSFLEILRFYNTPKENRHTGHILNGDSLRLAASQSVYYFSNHSVRLVVWRIILRRFGEWSSLSSLVQTLPTNSDGCTALHTGETVNTKLSHITSFNLRVIKKTQLCFAKVKDSTMGLCVPMLPEWQGAVFVK